MPLAALHRAMTSVGAIDYSFVLSEETQKLIGKLNESGLGDFIAQNLAYEFNRDYHKKRYYAAVRDCIRLTDRSPESLADCFPIRADDFVLEYRTVSDNALTVPGE